MEYKTLRHLVFNSRPSSCVEVSWKTSRRKSVWCYLSNALNCNYAYFFIDQDTVLINTPHGLKTVGTYAWRY
jgi:hypothetical protein